MSPRLLDRLRTLLAPAEDEHALLERVARVFRIATEITALEEPTEIPVRVVEALVAELGLPVASVVLEDPTTGQLAYAAERGVPPAVKAMGFRKEGIAMSVFRSGEARFVEDMGHDPSANPQARPFFQAYACLPIRSRERCFGLLFVNYGEPHPFPPTEREILRTFANQTAIALDNARLRRAERQRSAALAALANLGRDLARSLDPEDLMRVLERTLRDQFPALGGAAFWIKTDAGLQLLLRLGPGGALPIPPDLPEAASLLSLAEGEGPLPVPLAALAAWLGTPEAGAPEAQGLLLPLRTAEGLEGLVGLRLPAQAAQPGAAEFDFMSALADRAAPALHNARLYAATRRAAERDGLTQALNHATFMARLGAQLAESPERAQPFALLMLDADHFKACNDRYGHALGDRVLKALTAELRAHTRPGDTVGRLGGEEFAVLLPGAEAEAALQVAERIRGAMATLTLDLPDGSRVAAPTVSLGIALAPRHAREAQELLRLADEALYRAKAQGRNRVCLA